MAGIISDQGHGYHAQHGQNWATDYTENTDWANPTHNPFAESVLSAVPSVPCDMRLVLFPTQRIPVLCGTHNLNRIAPRLHKTHGSIGPPSGNLSWNF